MTMPHERTRSLRWGWEFLNEVQDVDNISLETRTQIKEILKHYPSGGEIKLFAAMDIARDNKWGNTIEPEDPKLLERQKCDVPEFVEREPVTPEQYAQSLADTYKLLKSFNITWTPEQRREILFVLRHFPCPEDIIIKADFFPKFSKSRNRKS